MITNRSAPSATVVPILIYEDVGQAIDWLCRAFGFSERLSVSTCSDGARAKVIDGKPA